MVFGNIVRYATNLIVGNIFKFLGRTSSIIEKKLKQQSIFVISGTDCWSYIYNILIIAISSSSRYLSELSWVAIVLQIAITSLHQTDRKNSQCFDLWFLSHVFACFRCLEYLIFPEVEDEVIFDAIEFYYYVKLLKFS